MKPKKKITAGRFAAVQIKRTSPGRDSSARPSRVDRPARHDGKRLEAARMRLAEILFPKRGKRKRKPDRAILPDGRLGENNILTVSTGRRQVSGVATKELCVVVHVRVKAHSSRVAASHVPKAIKGFPGIKTDVVATGLNRAHDRPALGGSSMAHQLMRNGSMACLVTRASQVQAGMRDLFVLGSNHTFALCNEAHKDVDHVLQPAWGAGGTDPTDAIGILADFVPLDFDGGTNVVDCAIARTNSQWVSPWIEQIGAFDPNPQDPSPGMAVEKVGVKTGRTTGVIEAITHPDNIDYDFPSARTAYFNPLIKISPDPRYPVFSDRGDSGALVLESSTKRPVGMIVSGDGVFSYACFYSEVLRLLGVDPFV